MKCEICGHDVEQHTEQVGCMHYDKNDYNPETRGYCKCRKKLKCFEENKKSDN